MPNIEDHLRKAMAEGKFDDLPGKGKPLHLNDDNPHADPEWEIAYHMLKDGGYSLPWIETMRAIEHDFESARKDLKLAWGWRQASISVSEPGAFAHGEWERALTLFKDRLATLNKSIRDYNLEVPNARFQRPVLDYEGEVEKVKAQES